MRRSQPSGSTRRTLMTAAEVLEGSLKQADLQRYSGCLRMDEAVCSMLLLLLSIINNISKNKNKSKTNPRGFMLGIRCMECNSQARPWSGAGADRVPAVRDLMEIIYKQIECIFAPLLTHTAVAAASPLSTCCAWCLPRTRPRSCQPRTSASSTTWLHGVTVTDDCHMHHHPAQLMGSVVRCIIASSQASSDAAATRQLP